jgi:two-component system, sensor histidine kinase and response regulator
MATPLNSKAKELPEQDTTSAGAPGETKQAALDGAAPKHRANILIVDDRQDKRLAMESIIEELGQNIIQASSGREALRHLLKEEFAVILLDVNMPGMDGFETALLIRESKRLENVPIIFVSAISDTETHVSRGYSLGAVDYILAPIVPEILRAKVSVFVELYKINEKVRQQADDLRLAHGELEARVALRTKELAVANESLVIEVQERKRAEEKLRQLNLELENRVSNRTAELLVANQELEAFSYSLAHDLRAPFRQIHGYSDLLQEEFASILPPEGRNYLRRIASKSREMGQMVDDLLNLFGVAKGKLDLSEINLTDLVDEIVSNSKEALRERSIVWKIGALPSVICSSGLIKQVFENLISNAIKYTRPRNPANIEIGSNRINGEDVIFVRDNGIGFDMACVDRLFGVFQRLHRSEEFEGTGVGLALSSKIVRKHGGRIWADGEVEKGATFSFTLGK